jgi:hypothetical protein
VFCFPDFMLTGTSCGFILLSQSLSRAWGSSVLYGVLSNCAEIGYESASKGHVELLTESQTAHQYTSVCNIFIITCSKDPDSNSIQSYDHSSRRLPSQLMN